MQPERGQHEWEHEWETTWWRSYWFSLCFHKDFHLKLYPGLCPSGVTRLAVYSKYKPFITKVFKSDFSSSHMKLKMRRNAE